MVAITDHDCISAAVRAEKYYIKIKKENPNFKLILGNEIYLCRDGLNRDNFRAGVDKYYHFILLAKDAEGHRQIREISTRAWSRAYVSRKMMRVPTYYSDLIDIIGRNPGHVIGSTACLGGCLATQLIKYKNNPNDNFYEKIKNWCLQIENIFGKDNFFLEMQPSKTSEQIYVNDKIIELSNELDIPFIITTDSHYLKPEDFSIHKAFLNAQEGERETESFYATTYLMNNEEIYKYMESYIGKDNLQKAFQNILNIKNSCEDYSLLKPLKIPYLPRNVKEPNSEYFNILKDKIPEISLFYNSKYDSDRHLLSAVLDKVVNDPQYQSERAYKEIGICLKSVWDSSEVSNTRWSAYLMNVRDYVDIAWTKGGTLVGPSRGSGGGFILLNILDITQINPLREKTKLYPWRFMNPERVSPLDIDIDIEGSKRESVYKALQKEYGFDRVSKVLTLRTEKSRSAILTAARGLGIDNDIAQYLSSMVSADRGIQRTLKQTAYGDEENDIPANSQFRREMEENYPELWEVALSIEGLINGVGSHAGGIIFVDEPFYNTTALMKTSNGDIVTQFDLHDAESCGQLIRPLNS